MELFSRRRYCFIGKHRLGKNILILNLRRLPGFLWSNKWFDPGAGRK